MPTLRAPHMDRTCSSSKRVWERLNCELSGGGNLHMLIWVRVPFHTWAELHLRPRARASLPSLPAWVCPVGSSPPARWVASRAGSPGPRGVLSPAPAALSRPVSPRAACSETQMVTAFFSMYFQHSWGKFDLNLLHRKLVGAGWRMHKPVMFYLLNLLDQFDSWGVFAF